MNKRRKLFLASLAALIALPGCASSWSNPFSSRPSASKPAFANQSSASKLSAGGNASLPDNSNSAYGEPASKSAGTQASPFSTASANGNVVTNAFRNAGNAVSSALTIHPKVTPANDAISLSSKTGKLGPEVYLEAARLAESRGNLDGAVQQYRRAIDIAPKNATAVMSLARLYDRQENFDEALKLYQRAIQIDDRNVAAHNDLGLCLARHGNLDESLVELAKAVSLQPDKQLYRNNLATVLAQAGRYDEALSQLTTAHGPAIAHYNLGHLLKQQDKLPLAAEHFRQAVALDPQLVPAQKMLHRLEATFASQGVPPPTKRQASPYHLQDEHATTGKVQPYSPTEPVEQPAIPRSVGGGEWSLPMETTTPPRFSESLVEPSLTERQSSEPTKSELEKPKLANAEPPNSAAPTSDLASAETTKPDAAKTEMAKTETAKTETAKAGLPPTAVPLQVKPESSPQAVEPPVSSRRTPELRFPNTGFSLPNIEGPIPPLPDEYRTSPHTLLPIPPQR